MKHKKLSNIISPNHSLAQKKYSLNENYFDEIDNEEKAYILGLYFADGYNNRKRNNIVLNLQERDKDILDKIKDKIEYSGPLLYDKKINRQNQYRLSFKSKQISENLENLGCMQAKSLIIEYPKNILNKFDKDFIRGFFDGNGSISKSITNNSCIFSITSTESMCNSIKEKIKFHLDIDLTIDHPKDGKYTENRIKYIRTSKRTNIRQIYNWFYQQNTELYLIRKREKFKEII